MIRKQYSYCRLLSPLGYSQYVGDCRPSTAFKLSTDYISRLAYNISTLESFDSLNSRQMLINLKHTNAS